MTLSRCETITDPAKFEQAHRDIIEAYEAKKETLHAESRKALERLIQPYRERLEKFISIKYGSKL